MHTSTKRFGHELGLSACFRQHRASSHCRFLHGYALAVTLTFDADHLDDRNWVMDFGGLKEVRGWLAEMFDHKTLVAWDDPERERFEEMDRAGMIQLKMVPATGCEAFAEIIFGHVAHWLERAEPTGRVRLASVTVSEHGANSASFERCIVEGANA